MTRRTPTARSGRSASASAGRPVARLVAPVIVRLGVLVALMALIAVAGVLLSTQAVDRLSGQVQPAAAANLDVLQDLTDMEAAVGAWARSGQSVWKDDYARARARLGVHERQVARFAADDQDRAA